MQQKDQHAGDRQDQQAQLHEVQVPLEPGNHVGEPIPQPHEQRYGQHRPEQVREQEAPEWGEFSGADLARATAALSKLQLGDKLSQRQVEYAIGYWVYIPPMKDKSAVNRKIAQLKARGIEEYFVVSDAGPWQNAISLGVFKTREAAQHFLDELQRTKDVRTAQLGERASQLKVTIFMLNGLDAKAAADLAAIHKDFAGSELKDTPCALTR